MPSETPDASTNGIECFICGETERPTKGWIYRPSDVIPDEVREDGLKWKAKDDAHALCSLDCLDEYKERRRSVDTEEDR
jgi:hypothetical protein